MRHGAIHAALNTDLGGSEDTQAGQVADMRVQCAAKAAGLHHPSERTRVAAGLEMVEMQMQPRRPAPDPPDGDPNIQNWIGRIRQSVPHARLQQQHAGPGGDRIIAAVEGGMRHRRQSGPIDQDCRDAGRRLPTGQRAADGSGPDNADIGGQSFMHAVEPYLLARDAGRCPEAA